MDGVPLLRVHERLLTCLCVCVSDFVFNEYLSYQERVTFCVTRLKAEILVAVGISVKSASVKVLGLVSW